jgi:predicted nucleotidyltransferase
MANKPKNKPFNGTQPAPEPRQESEIQSDVDQLVKHAGETQYKVFVYQQDLENINARLVALNNEAFKRRQLDAAAKQSETTGA